MTKTEQDIIRNTSLNDDAEELLKKVFEQRPNDSDIDKKTHAIALKWMTTFDDPEDMWNDIPQWGAEWFEAHGVEVPEELTGG
jgi:hypothetical protein